MVSNFLKKERICVLSTASKEGKTESAIMSYTLKPNLSFIFSTLSKTRKLKNILENNFASIIVGGFNNDPCIQIDGLITNLEGESYDDAKKFVLEYNPSLQEYITPDHKFFEFKPTWMRYVDYSLPQPETEFTDF